MTRRGYWIFMVAQAVALACCLVSVLAFWRAGMPGDLLLPYAGMMLGFAIMTVVNIMRGRKLKP
jgi:hypothetical protein